MTDHWNNKQPIYMQLRDRVAGLIMDGVFVEGEAIPSVRHVSAQENINHITVAKAYQALVDEGVLEMKRGRGMFVLKGAREALIANERSKFEINEVPALLDRLQHLNMTVDELATILTQQQNVKQVGGSENDA